MNDSFGALYPFGWNDRVLALFSDFENDGLEPARVIRIERSRCIAVTASGSEAELLAPLMPAVGDWVAVSDRTVRHVLPRWSELARGDPSGAGVQVLAANIDLVLITAPSDRLSPARVERELAVAWDSGAQPVVVLTKIDLAAPGAARELQRRLVGIEVVATSATTGQGIPEVQDLLRPARTAALLGPSGAGKSSLTNALLGSDVLAIAAVRDEDRRGRHTTTSRQLVTVPGGGVIIDTPGLRSLALAGDVALDRAFPEVDALADACRFSDCRHEAEPGCAVTSAVSTGDLEPARLASFRKLQREAAAEGRRTDPLARQAQLRMWKSRTKSLRSFDKRRPR